MNRFKTSGTTRTLSWLRRAAIVLLLGVCFVAPEAASQDAHRTVAQHEQLRRQIRQLLGIPPGRCDLAAEPRGQFERDGIVVEKWVWTAEPGSRVPALLFRPARTDGPMPAIVFTYGHGGSKSSWAYKWIHQHLGTPGWTREKLRALPTLNAGQWCDTHAIPLEKLYGTPLHWRGASLPDLGLRPLRREELACLRPDEIGRPEFTLEGWLETIERNRRQRGIR